MTSIKHTIHLIYDGECIMCRHTAKALKLKKAAGELTLINARQGHDLVRKAVDMGYNLNKGILVLYGDQYFYGSDAIHFLALLGGSSDFFNRANVRIFKYKLATCVFYPFFKVIRQMLLLIRKTPKIKEPATIYASVFSKTWDSLPELFKYRYSNQSFTTDNITLKGEMDIEISKFFKFLSPLLRAFGALVPYSGEKVPVEVALLSNKKDSSILMNRTFFYKNKPPYQFNSLLLKTKKNRIIELMRWNIGVSMQYHYQNGVVYINQHA